MLAIWFAGAFIMTIYHTFEDRANCVKDEGLKGLIWCSSEPTTSYARAETHTSRFMKGAMWPLNLVSEMTLESVETNVDRYSCRELLSDIQYARTDAAALARVISAMPLLKEEDDEEVRMMYRSAISYYGRKPSDDEIRSFAFKSAQMGLEICKDNGSMGAKQALLLGGDHLAKKKHNVRP